KILICRFLVKTVITIVSHIKYFINLNYHPVHMVHQRVFKMHPKQLVQMVILQLKLLTILHHIIEDNKCIMYYTKIKFTLIMLSVISCVGCKSLSGQDAQTDDTSVVDILIFKNNEEVIEGKYSVIKEFVKD